MIFNAKVNKSTSRLKPAGLARNRISEDRISEEALYFDFFNANKKDFFNN